MTEFYRTKEALVDALISANRKDLRFNRIEVVDETNFSINFGDYGYTFSDGKPVDHVEGFLKYLQERGISVRYSLNTDLFSRRSSINPINTSVSSELAREVLNDFLRTEQEIIPMDRDIANGKIVPEPNRRIAELKARQKKKLEGSF